MLDIMMPGMDGLSLCQTLRSHGNNAAIIFLTARDTLAGFESGADDSDDYQVKPFDLPELAARLKTITKRKISSSSKRQVADLEVNLDDHKATRGERISHPSRCWSSPA